MSDHKRPRPLLPKAKPAKSVEPPIDLSLATFSAPDLPTARALLAPFDLARFNLTAAWQPATKDVAPVGAPWRDDLAGRSLLHAP